MTVAVEPASVPPQPGRSRQRVAVWARQARLASAVLAGTGIVVQICYPLTSGRGAVLVTVASVLLLAGAALTHAFSVARVWWVPLGVLVAAAGVGWISEALGVRTGVPFGSYEYTGLLGPKVLDVPVLVPLAWTMLAYPCLLAGRRLARGSRWGTAVLGGLCLAAWDLFLDPQMVELGAWEWRFPTPSLPGIDGIPLTNFAGWIVVALVMIAVLDRVVPPVRGQGSEVVPAAVLAWTWLGSSVGNLVFFGRPWVALWGFVVMGLVAGPYLWHLLRARP